MSKVVLTIICGILLVGAWTWIYTNYRCQRFRDTLKEGKYQEAFQMLPYLYWAGSHQLCQGPIQNYIQMLLRKQAWTLFDELVTWARPYYSLQVLILGEIINAQLDSSTVAKLYKDYLRQWPCPSLIQSSQQWCRWVSIEQCLELRNEVEKTCLAQPLTPVLIQRIPAVDLSFKFPFVSVLKHRYKCGASGEVKSKLLTSSSSVF